MHHCQSGRVFLLIRSKEDADIFYNEHQHSSLRLNYTFLNTFPQNPVFSDWVSVFKRERTVWNTSLHPPFSPSLPLSLPRCLPLQSSSRPALLSAAMAAEAAGRDDATAGPEDCTEMGERVRCFFCLFFFFFRIISDAVFAETDRMEERPAPPGLSGLWHRCSSRDGEKLCSTAATLTSPAV